MEISGRPLEVVFSKGAPEGGGGDSVRASRATASLLERFGLRGTGPMFREGFQHFGVGSVKKEVGPRLEVVRR